MTAVWLVMGFTFALNAQEQEKPVTKTFYPGWYIGANLGVNMFAGEGNDFIHSDQSNYKFSGIKGTSFLGRAELGYKFTPVIGLRGFLGYMHTNWYDASRLINTTDYTKPFGSEVLTADFMVNLSNWWAGYNPERKVDFSVFAGAGVGYLNNNVTYSKFAAIGRAGIQGDYHLSPVLDLNLIAEANVTGDNYNDLVKGIPADAFSALTVGVTYRLSGLEKKEAKTPVVEPEIIEKKDTVKPTVTEPVVEPVAIAQTETKPVEVKVEETIKPVIQPVIAPEPVSAALNEKIFYTINKATIAENNEAMLNVVNFLKQHPEATVIVNGYADYQTGTVEYNNKISKQRAENIANTLINKYSVNAKRIQVKWFGGSVQPFNAAVKNRLVVIEVVK